MPHLIIEYSKESATDGQAAALVDAVHEAAMDSGLFESSHIKTRAIALAHYRSGTGGPFIHAQLRIKPGRNEEQKKILSESVLAAIRSQELYSDVITVEVVEMDGYSYARHSA